MGAAVESIKVYYGPALNIPGVYHKYIVYTNSAGEQYAARGGTGGPGGSTLYGSIDTQVGPYNDSFTDYDPSNSNSETIKEGNDLSDDWQNIEDAMRDIEAERHQYRPLDQKFQHRRRRSPSPEQSAAADAR